LTDLIFQSDAEIKNQKMEQERMGYARGDGVEDTRRLAGKKERLSKTEETQSLDVNRKEWSREIVKGVDKK